MSHNKKQNAFLTLNQWIISIGNSLSILFLVCTLIIVIEIIARYIFNSPTIWVHETTVLISSFLFLYAGSFTLANNKHIRIAMLHDLLSPTLKYYVDSFVLGICILYSSLMVYASYIVAQKSLFTPWGTFRMETSGSAWDPVIPALIKSFLFLALSLMLIQFVLQFIQHIKEKKDV
ncbi:MAG: C4-dicarboxylate ABC transporter permease [Arcobacter sp.]|nr:MAG: C4-dicarboxylate ABC transporter permease [Arcobacter sp.]